VRRGDANARSGKRIRLQPAPGFREGVMIASAIGMVATIVTAAAGEYAQCPPLDISRFWIPPDVEYAEEEFLAKAKRMNDAGTCVIDGWFGRNYGRFYYTVIPPGGDNLGKVISFSFEQLKK
jgi:hypothetical protein